MFRRNVVFALLLITAVSALGQSSAVVTNCVPVSGGFKLEWIPGGEAVVKWTPDLMVPFSNLSGTLPAGQGSYTDSVHGADDKCFYLVELLTPGGMVLIPGGVNSGTDPDFGAYSLTVSSFYMDATEVTKAQWDVVYNWAIAHDYSFDYVGSGKASDHPVNTISWWCSVKWCNARSQMEGLSPCYTVDGIIYKAGFSENVDCNFSAGGYRLPNGDEWEYAARGGLSGKRFPWGDTIAHGQANYYSSEGDSFDISPTSQWHPLYAIDPMPYTSPVGSFSANGYGLYDMAGNVFEWYWENHYFRGGSWNDEAFRVRCGSGDSGAGYRDDIGFRTVRNAD